MTERPRIIIQDVVCTSPIGIPGTLRILERERERLLQRYTRSYLQKAEQRMKEGSSEYAAGYECVEHDGAGGIYAMLWRLAEKAGTGLRVDLKSIPVLQETIEICNTLDIDPYCMESSGALYLSGDGQKLCGELHRKGFPCAAVIGRTSADRKRLVLYDDTERFLTRPKPEQSGD